MIAHEISWEEIFHELDERRELSTSRVHWAMGQLLQGATEIKTVKSFLLKLKAKGETPNEVCALVDQMYEFATHISIPERSVDIVGTGGDGADTINISTTAAIVTTAAGARVVKHGNRAASSKSGSADLLEALGINITLGAEGVAECVRRIGIGFAFAPTFHPSMRFATQARKELGISTIFNILGPLANPAKPIAIAVGVAGAHIQLLAAQVLAKRGCEGFVFRGDDGLDELTLSTTSMVFQVANGEIREEVFDPTNLNIDHATTNELAGGDAAFNARVAERIFAGEQGAYRDAVLLNAAAAIAAFKADFSLSVEQQFANGLTLARKAVDTGEASRVLVKWRELSQQLATQGR